MLKRFSISLFALLAAVTYSSTAWACISGMYRDFTSYPLDYLPIGALFGSFAVARMWTKAKKNGTSPPHRRPQLKRYGLWMLASYCLGLFASTSFGFDLTPRFVLAGISSVLVLIAILYPGWKIVRKGALVLGGAVAMFACLSLFAFSTFGDYSPEKFEQRQPIETQVTF